MKSIYGQGSIQKWELPALLVIVMLAVGSVIINYTSLLNGDYFDVFNKRIVASLNSIQNKACSPQAVEQIVNICHLESGYSKDTPDICKKASSINISYLSEPSLPPEWLNKTILFVGDSQDFSTIGTFCELLIGNLTWIDYFGRIIIPQERGMEGGGHIPRACLVRRNNGFIIIINVFHYGVNGDTYSHIDNSNSWLNSSHRHWKVAANRVKMVPWILYSLSEIETLLQSNASIAEKYNLANLNQSEPTPTYDFNPESVIDSFILNNDKSKLPFPYPEPNFIIASSSLWDLNSWRHNLKIINDTDFLPVIKQWPQNMTTRLLEPLQRVFPNVPLVMRTTPLTVLRYSPGVVDSLNDEVRRLGREKGIGVLDWAKKSIDAKYLGEDGFHQTPMGRKILIDDVVRYVALWGLANEQCMMYSIGTW
ncbi:hypothetical protein HDU76_006564 [Blyttiomyces sp. JEL0837]|nr:hypothetical protein HDU76_006564 [Blyttiomyces sp. JEL0837]